MTPHHSTAFEEADGDADLSGIFLVGGFSPKTAVCRSSGR